VSVAAGSLMTTALVVSTAPAATFTWTGASFANVWSNNLNWDGFSAPPSNGTADIAFNSSISTFPIVDHAWDVHSVKFTSSAFNLAYTLGGSTLTIQGGGISNTSVTTQTVTNDIVLGADQTWNAASAALSMSGAVDNAGHVLTVTGNGNTTLGDVVSGAGGLTKSGDGILQLNAANTFAGDTAINAGHVWLANGAALQSSTVNINVANGLLLNGIDTTLGALAGTGDLAVGTSQLTVGQNNADTTYGGTLSGDGVLTKVGAGTMTLTGGTAANPSTLSQLVASAGVLTLNAAHLNVDGEQSLWFQTAVNVTGGAVVTQVSPGNFFEVDGSSASLVVSDAGSEVHSRSQFNIGDTSAGSATAQNGGKIASDNFIVVGLNTGGVGNLLVRTGGVASAPNIYLGAYGTSQGNAIVSDFGSTLSATAGLHLGGVVDTNPDHVASGHLTVQSGGRATAATTDFWGDNSSILVDRGTFTTGGLTAEGTGATIALSDSAVAAAMTVSIAPGTTDTFGGTISDGPHGAGSLFKTGAGILELTAFNTYTGRTTVFGGTLRLNGGSTASSFSVDSGILQLNNGVQVNLGFGEIVANATVKYDNAIVNGGFLRGGGHTIQAGGATFNGTSTSSSAVIGQLNPATLRNFTNRGRIENTASLTLDNFVNEASGVLNVHSTVLANEVESDGVVNVLNGGTFNNTIAAPLVLGGGSQTFVGSVAHPGGAINLSNRTIELNGGLLVNNGLIAGGVVNINFGGLAKGAGSYAGGYNVHDGGRIIFGNSPGTLHSGSATWGTGGSLDFQINDATGAAGTNWGLNDITGTLAIAAGTTDASKFVITLNSLDAGNNPAAVAHFDPMQDYSWVFATTTDGITGFDRAKFVLDTSGFTNDLQGGTFSLFQSGDNLGVQFDAVPEPGGVTVVGLGLVALMRRRRRRRQRGGRASDCR
jgi:autotransporter-associated beta strand protein